MRALGVASVIVLVSCGFLACGKDDSGGGPPGGGGSGGSSDAGPDEQLQPELGTCKPMCCTDAECGTGKTCTPFESGAGSLGLCSGGTDPATATAHPAGATLPLTCWSVEPSICNPFSNEGCGADEVCDYASGTTGVKPVVDCFGGGNTQADGESCDNALGPWCMPGLHCVPLG